jgi:MinD-like ATPase involved in chromosome partitioning or flagellar assembly
MARISDIQRYNNARKDSSRDNPDFETLRFENKNGDVMVVKPQEVRDVLHDFIDSEVGFLGDAMKNQIKERLDFKLKQIEYSLNEHIEEKINKLTEKILEKTIDRIVEQEINRRVLEKIKKCI